MTGTIPQPGDLDDHHIVPKAWGMEHDLEAPIDTILNRTPLTATTNLSVVRDRLPNEYIPALIEDNGELRVRKMLESHLISPVAFDILTQDPFTKENYEAFLKDRRRTIQEAIEELLVKERLDLSPRLHELDAQVEAVELAIRDLVKDAVTGNDAALPHHVLQKIEDRIGKALSKHSALDVNRYSVLDGKLEYADLRDLQDVVTNKSLAPLFSRCFPNKETLVKRFDQLAELSNGIRHSRTVDEVARKEGEAAVAWFLKVLGGEP